MEYSQHLAINREWKRNNRERVRLYTRAWRKRNRQRLRAYDAAYKRKWRKLHKIELRPYWAQQVKLYNLRNPRKVKARHALRKAVEYGKVQKPNRCSHCGRRKSRRMIHGHHYLGYARRHWLHIKWLCRDCHWEIH